jgi:type IV pilus assembly protein PilE
MPFISIDTRSHFESLRTRQAEKGFTLVEIMIAVVLLAILAAVGYPQYTNHVATGYIAEAHADLMDYKNKLESYYQDEKSYRSGTSGSTCGIPATAYNTGGKKFSYACTADEESFTVTATPSVPVLDGIGFTINNNGAKQTFKGTTTTITQATCWAKKRGGEC